MIYFRYSIFVVTSGTRFSIALQNSLLNYYSMANNNGRLFVSTHYILKYSRQVLLPYLSKAVMSLHFWMTCVNKIAINLFTKVNMMAWIYPIRDLYLRTTSSTASQSGTN